MSIADRSYSMNPWQDPGFNRSPGWDSSEGYLHLVVVDARDPSQVVRENSFAVSATVCGNGPPQSCTSTVELARATSVLNSLAGDPTKLVFLQSVGRLTRVPGVDTSEWPAMAQMIGELGGDPHVLMDPDLANFALVGGKMVVAEMVLAQSRPEPVETSNVIPNGWDGTPMPASLSGLLRQNNSGYFTPDAPTYSADPTLQEIAYQPPQPWPQMDTTGKRAAYGYFNQLLGIEDLRTAYYENENDPWDSYETRLTNANYPAGNTGCGGQQTGQTDSRFTFEEFCAVRDELIDELEWRQAVKNFIDNLQDLKGGEDGDVALVDVQAIATAITNELPVPGNTGVILSDVLAVTAALVGVAAGAPELSAAAIFWLGAASGAFSIVSQFTPLLDGGSPLQDHVQTIASKLPAEMLDRANGMREALNRLRDIVVSDYGKLSTVGTAVQTSWVFNTDTQNESTNRLNLATRRTAYNAIVGGIGTVLTGEPWINWPHNAKTLTKPSDFSCSIWSDAPDHPFSGVPENATALLTIRDNPPPGGWKNAQKAQIQAQPPWTVYGYFLDSGGGYRAPKSEMTEPASRLAAPGREYDPSVNGGYGYYLPWLLGHTLPKRTWVWDGAPKYCEG
jgi:hypothetical protein